MFKYNNDMDGKIVILMGMSGVGKDAIRKIITEEFYYENIVSYTSRPKRENEIEGIDYHFISQEQFNNMIDNNEMIEYRNYETYFEGKNNTWFYGVKKFVPQKHTDYIIVMDLEGAESIIRYFGKENCILIYLTANDDIRKERAINRGSFDELEWNRRLNADYKDFNSSFSRKFMNDYKVWKIKNEIKGEVALYDIVDMINFICKGRLS